MPDVAVIFGGPSPEHDVSVLTGLQAARGLAAATSPGGRGRRPGPVLVQDRGLVRGRPSAWRPRRSSRGCPEGRPEAAAGGRPRRGLLRARRAPGTARALDIDAALVCCHGGPGEDGTLQAALDLAGIRYSGPTVAGAALGMDKLAFGSVDGGRRPAHPAPGPAGARTANRRRSPVPTSSSPASAGRRSASTWSRTSPPPGPGWRPTRTSGSAPCSSPTAPTSPTCRWRCAPGRRWSSRRWSGPSGPRRHGRHPRLPRQVRGRRGDGRGQPRAPGPDLARAGEGPAGCRRADRRPGRGQGGGPHRLPLRRGAVRRQRDQHHPRLAGPLPLGGPRPCPSPRCSPTCWPRPASDPPTPTPPPVPTGRSSVRRDRSPASWAEALGRPPAPAPAGREGPGRHQAPLVVPPGPAGRGHCRHRLGVALDVGFPHTSVALHWIEGLVVAVPCLGWPSGWCGGGRPASS